ncbi:MAG: hypothetical protein JSV52_04470 [Candidatus Zixiibacteriota bacterium]|nr:MAG: hypothetical protein JSV52_04470 [candidate division Zixibacteria bacterium]
MNESKAPPLTGKFSIWEKIYAQGSFAAMGVAGAVGIILEDWIWAIPYALIGGYGIPGIVMRHLTCPRCPHLHVYGDCLQAPPSMTKWLIKRQKTHPFGSAEKFLLFLIAVLIPAYPLYWLWSNKWLLAIFLVSTIMWYSGQVFYFCKRCRVKECPLNRTNARI